MAQPGHTFAVLPGQPVPHKGGSGHSRGAAHPCGVLRGFWGAADPCGVLPGFWDAADPCGGCRSLPQWGSPSEPALGQGRGPGPTAQSALPVPQVLGAGREFVGPGKEALRRVILEGKAKSGIFFRSLLNYQNGEFLCCPSCVPGRGLCSLSKNQQMSAQDRKKQQRASNPLKHLCHNHPGQS